MKNQEIREILEKHWNKREYAEYLHKSEFEKLKKELEPLQSYVSVSDKEIEKTINELKEQRASNSFMDGFFQGAKWMRDKLQPKKD